MKLDMRGRKIEGNCRDVLNRVNIEEIISLCKCYPKPMFSNYFHD